MDRCKKVFSLLLAIVLLWTVFPGVVFSEDTSQTNGGDAFVYNCGKGDITVEWPTLDSNSEDDIFNEDGSYTIQLEDDAFFPYEIQFQYGGKKWVETFETSDSTVVIGGHEINVSSNYNGSSLSQIGVYVDGKYIAAKSETKHFSGGSPRSLLPLEEYDLTLDLTSYSPSELKNVKIETILNDSTKDDESAPDDYKTKAVFWNFPEGSSSDNFPKIGTGTVDLSGNIDSITIIVGSESQLDKNNIKYRIEIKKSSISPFFHAELYAQDKDGTRNPIDDEYIYIYGGEVSFKLPISLSLQDEYFLNIYSDNNNIYDNIKIYEGSFDTDEDAKKNGTDITDQIYGKDAGYKKNYSTAKSFTIVYKFKEELISITKFSVQVNQKKEEEGSKEPKINFSGLYYDNESGREKASYYTFSSSASDIKKRTVTLEKGYAADREYYAGFTCDNAQVEKAVVGHFDSLEQAINETDIKDALFPGDITNNGGYLANYKDGVNFTIFTDNNKLYKYTIIAQQMPASTATFFYIDGVEGIDRDKFYSVSSKNDSSVGMFEYQAFIINDTDVNLTKLKPIFRKPSEGSVFVNGKEQFSGTSEQDFSKGPVQYTVEAENGIDHKNYWITFVKRQSGTPKLFVVQDGEKPGEREIFFNRFTNHYDIFIANIGTEKLTGLNAELQNPQNIKLDDYWKLGGDGINELAGLSENSNNNSYSEERENIAKIRLLPDGRGEISGKLIISSDNGESVILNLIGFAGSPAIITDIIEDGVQYVPYSFLLQTDNKYDWNKVTFEWRNGELPDGMILRPSGELYGVPTVTGNFHFEVTAENSDSRFDNSVKEFDLTIKENTDENVASEIDGGYSIQTAIPRYFSRVQDYEFKSEGEYSNFIDFWIDGEKQIKNTDYKVEEGSTKITVLSQTFSKYGTGTHTIAAEFRVGGDANKDLKRTAQNYTLNTNSGTNKPSNNSGNHSSSSNSGGGSSNSSSGGSSSSGKKPLLNGSSGSSASNRTNLDGISSNGVSNGTFSNNNSNSNALQENIESTSQETTNAQAVAQQINLTRIKNANYISLTRLQKLASDAQQAGLIPQLEVDTMILDALRTIVGVRVGINPALANSDLQLAALPNSPESIRIKALFEKYFSNEIPVVIDFSQKGSFGQIADIAVKVPTNLNAEELVLYSYNSEENTYWKIQEHSAWIDVNGYLHFKTDYAGTTLISQGDLTKRITLVCVLSSFFTRI